MDVLLKEVDADIPSGYCGSIIKQTARPLLIQLMGILTLTGLPAAIPGVWALLTDTQILADIIFRREKPEREERRDKVARHTVMLLLVTLAGLSAHSQLTSGAALIPLSAFLSRGLHRYSVSGVTSEAGKDKVWGRHLTQPLELPRGTTPHEVHHWSCKVTWDLRQQRESRGQCACSQMHQNIPEATSGKRLSQSRSSKLLAFLSITDWNMCAYVAEIKCL